MIEIRKTEHFDRWLSRLKDRDAKQKIALRIRRAAFGNLGDHKLVGEGVSEMRLSYGPGYRVYFTRQGEAIIILLCGGTKRRQANDIALAKSLAKEISDGT